MARLFVRWSRKILPLLVCACGPSPTPSSPPAPTRGTEPGRELRPGAAEPVANAAEAPDAGVQTPEPEPPKLYAIDRVAWVYDQPNRKSRKLGYIGVGMGVVLRESSPLPRVDGCPRGFYAVEPRGFVCGNRMVTDDPQHPTVVALHAHARPSGGSYPFRYGLSLGAPMYNKLPDAETHRVVMMRYPAPRKLADWARYFEDLAVEEPDIEVKPVPEFLRNGSASPNATSGYVRRTLPHGSMIAFTQMFEHEGRRWLLADDLSVVPAERVRVYRQTAFRGVAINERHEFPFGWICGGDRPRYERGADGKIVATPDLMKHHELVRLTDETEGKGKHRFRRLRDGGWVRADHVCEVKGTSRMPEGVTDDGRWLYLSTLEQTLVAYEGLKPVYATLHASGRGGVHRGKGDVRNYTTPVGGFHVNWKERFATFSPDPGAPTTFWITNVMFVQFFEQPYALHGAYWHERFGVPTSAGCPNLSPHDAEWLFTFTQPSLPDGWQAIGPARGESGTLVVVGP